MIAERLTGKTFFVTGGTGFLGTALAERILAAIPDSKLILLVRPGRRSSAMDRAWREVVKNDAFGPLKEQLGAEFEPLMRARVSAVAGDVSKEALGLDENGLEALASADYVIHSAATVSFDSPLPSAVSVNLLGPSNVASAIKLACATAGIDPLSKHFITVSTSYVAGYRRGLAPERLLRDTRFSPVPAIDDEVAFATDLRARMQSESREPENLASFEKKARYELGAAGGPLLAEKLEKIRQEWVDDRLVEIGRARAQSLGWPDAYTFTKALGEEMLARDHSDLAISVVRPSIIESSMIHPYAGWIKGFRMAEPIIVSYARGLLKEFPGVPEGILDVIPVDFVTSAILATAAGPTPEPGAIPVYQVASGARNPLRYKRLVDLVRNWFHEHPVYDADGQPIQVPEWNFPGRGRVQRQLAGLSRNLDLVDSIARKLPLRGERAELVTDLDEKRQAVKRALSYVELYGSYAETEAIFDVTNLLGLAARLDDGDGADFLLDPNLIDWDRFVTEVHLPSVVRHARIKTTPERKGTTNRRESRQTEEILSDTFRIAVFDLENTVIASNVVDAFAWYATRDLPLGKKALFALALLAEGPNLMAVDRADRGDFLRSFYRRYSRAERADLAEKSNDLFNGYLLKKAFPRAIERIRRHRAHGHKTILITGALDFVIEPLAPLFDDVVACTMTEDARGRLTGNLDVAPPTGEARALLVEDFARSYGITTQESVAYADSTSDLPMLEAVGYPVAVNPEPKLLQIAKKRGWPVENWQRQQGHSPLLLPIGRSL